MTTTITLPRATVEQALEAFRMCVPMDGRHAEVDAAFRNLRAALAEPVEPVKHKHQWFSTGGMEPGQMRCIHCGVWGRSPATLFDPRGSLGEPIV